MSSSKQSQQNGNQFYFGYEQPQYEWKFSLIKKVAGKEEPIFNGKIIQYIDESYEEFLSKTNSQFSQINDYYFKRLFPESSQNIKKYQLKNDQAMILEQHNFKESPRNYKLDKGIPHEIQVFYIKIENECICLYESELRVNSQKEDHILYPRYDDKERQRKGSKLKVILKPQSESISGVVSIEYSKLCKDYENVNKLIKHEKKIDEPEILGKLLSLILDTERQPIIQEENNDPILKALEILVELLIKKIDYERIRSKVLWKIKIFFLSCLQQILNRDKKHFSSEETQSQ